MGQQSLHFHIITGVRAVIGVQFRLSFIRRNLILKLRDLLARIRQRIGFSIESLHAMTAHAAALIEEILAQVERVRALRNAIVRVTHLASRFGVLLMKQRMQPEWILTVGLHGARRGATVAAMTSRAAEFLRVMNLQQFFARVTDKCSRPFIRFFAGALRRNIRRLDCEGLARSQVTNLATIYNGELVDVDLMTE